MKEDPPAGAKCKDKFLVQSTFITPERENVPLADIWNMTNGEGVYQQKVKVVYLPPEGEPLMEADESMDRSMDDSRFAGDHSAYATVRGSQNGHPNVLDAFVPIHRNASPSGHNERSPSPAQGDYIIAHEDSTQHETHYGEPSPSPGVVNINVHSHARTPDDETQGKYVEAQEEISRLKALVASLAASSQKRQSEESGLRRRTRAPTDDGSYIDSIADDETVVERSGGSGISTESGVPLQVVIIIALGVFVTTYLFF